MELELSVPIGSSSFIAAVRYAGFRLRVTSYQFVNRQTKTLGEVSSQPRGPEERRKFTKETECLEGNRNATVSLDFQTLIPCYFSLFSYNLASGFARLSTC